MLQPVCRLSCFINRYLSYAWKNTSYFLSIQGLNGNNWPGTNDRRPVACCSVGIRHTDVVRWFPYEIYCTGYFKIHFSSIADVLPSPCHARTAPIPTSVQLRINSVWTPYELRINSAYNRSWYVTATGLLRVYTDGDTGKVQWGVRGGERGERWSLDIYYSWSNPV